MIGLNHLGTIFVKLLKLIAIPLILASLIKGISDLKDISKFKTIGIRTIITIYITTVIAISIGLLLSKCFYNQEMVFQKKPFRNSQVLIQTNSSVQDKITEATIQRRKWTITIFRRHGS